MWGMDAVTSIELEAERRREVLLSDAARMARSAEPKDPARRRTRSLSALAASIAQVVVVRLATLRT